MKTNQNTDFSNMLDLQFFADDDDNKGGEGGVNTDNTPPNDDKTKGGEGEGGKSAPSNQTNYDEVIADLKKQISDRDRKVNELFTEMGNLKRDKLTDEEKFALDKQEFEKQKQQFIDQQKEFEKERMKNYVSDKLSSLGYLNGLNVDEIANLKNMVLADTVEEADKRIDALASTLGRITNLKLGDAAKPGATKSDTKTVWNPFLPDQFNVTEQHKLWKSDPDKAKQLEEAAKKASK